jgi:large subunit ribosomal protein L15
MTLGLHNLYPGIGSKKTSKRLGRGNASGKGTTAARGVKGQKARTGGRGGLKLMGMRDLMLSTPKLPGFTSIYPQNQVVKLSDLEKSYKAGELVNPISLKVKKIILDAQKPVKILSTGELTKKLSFEGCLFSKSARAKIEGVGGEIKE